MVLFVVGVKHGVELGLSITGGLWIDVLCRDVSVVASCCVMWYWHCPGVSVMMGDVVSVIMGDVVSVIMGDVVPVIMGDVVSVIMGDVVSDNGRCGVCDDGRCGVGVNRGDIVTWCASAVIGCCRVEPSGRCDVD